MAEPSAPRSSAMMPRLVGGLLFGVLVYVGMVVWIDLDNLVAALEDFPLLLVPAALGLSLANYLIRYLKWERYRKLLAIDLDQRTSFLIYLAGFSMGITPGKMGEVFKSWLIRQVNGTRIHRSAPIVVAERLTDLLGYLVLVALGGIASHPEYLWVFGAVLAASAGAILLIGSARFASGVTYLLARTPFLWRLASRVEGSFEASRILLSPRELLWPTLLSVVSWGCECVGFWLIADAMVEEDLPFLFAVFTYAIAAVAGAVAIVFPGGLGVTEVSMGSLLRRKLESLADLTTAAARSKAAGAILLTRFCTLWFAVALGLIATAIFRRRFGQLDLAPDR